MFSVKPVPVEEKYTSYLFNENGLTWWSALVSQWVL